MTYSAPVQKFFQRNRKMPKILSKRHLRRKRAANIRSLMQPSVHETDEVSISGETETIYTANPNVSPESSTFGVNSFINYICPVDVETVHNDILNSSVENSSFGVNSIINDMCSNQLHECERTVSSLSPTDDQIESHSLSDDDNSTYSLHSTDSEFTDNGTSGDDSNDKKEARYTFSVDKIKFIEDLRRLLCQSNVPNQTVNKLLKLIKPAYSFLPTDARTLLGTPKKTDVISLENGEMCYFGLKSCLIRKLDGGIAAEGEIIVLDFNMDGLPIFKSSATELWPILGRSKFFKDEAPFMIATFCGVGKPKPLDQCLEAFIDEVNLLQELGFQHNTKTYFIKIGCFACDAPARAMLKMIKGHNSRYGCERCTMKSKTENRTLFYPTRTTIPPRLRQDHDYLIDRIDRRHINGKSPLLRLRNIRLKSHFVMDPLHLIYVGVEKRLMVKRWVDGDRQYKLSKQNIAAMDYNIESIRPYVPSDFVRKPRSLRYLKRWKATEFRFFLLYGGPVITYNIIDNEKYQHFMLLHTAVTILSSRVLISSFIHRAEEFLKDFVLQSANIYGPEFVSYNVHTMLHVCDDVRTYGSLEEYSCFPFESYLNQIKRRVRSKHSVLQQISNRVAELARLDADIVPPTPYYTPKKVRYPQPNSINYFQCESLCFGKNEISTKRPDDIVAVGREIYCISSIICINGVYKCIGIPFRYVRSLYRYPMDSSELGIYYVHGFRQATTFLVEEILHKCVRFRFKEGFAIFPILHLKNI